MRRAWWIGLLALGCSPKAPCERLASAICDEGTASACAAFVDAQMRGERGPLAGESREAACQIVLDDEATTAAFERAFVAGLPGGG